MAGLTASAGSQLAFRFDVVGTQLKLRVWDAAGADPGTWQTTATDSTAGLAVAGAAGLRVYVGANVPNGPVTFSFDGIEIRKG